MVKYIERNLRDIMLGNNTWKITVAAAAVLLLLVIGWLFYKKGSVSPSGNYGGAGGGSGGSATRQVAPSNISVPDASSANVPADVAKPQIVGPANPSASASFRSFTITIKGNAFLPSTVIVNKGDTAHINFTAVDKEYDFTQPDYGFYVLIPKGQTKLAEFSATAEGKFTFFCKACGGPQKGPTGSIIVAPR